ncbi:hypothetical protein OIV83_004545 [Microbotryomycetes sp. JL201]|nr:hypothetical protein OIV83_004545 [Microbotryomycetes sp. JL201]
MFKSIAALAVLGAFTVPTAEAFWRFIMGGSNFALSNTFDNLFDSECTSCKVKQDKSAYWIPSLYFQWANGSFSPVKQVGGGLIYYLQRGENGEKISAFPDGLRVLAGNPFLRSYDPSSQTAQAIGWNCLGGNIKPTRNPWLPAEDCPNGLRAEIRMPSCWDGKNVDSTNHFDHMAYSSRGEFGTCPSTHPIRVVTLFYEVLWSVHDWAGLRDQAMNKTQPFVLANGDPTGFGLHGDFLDGWDKQVLQQAVDSCTDDSGVIEYCKVFDLYDDQAQCRKTPDVNEIVDLPVMPKLPGCNPVTGFGPTAKPCSEPAPIISNPVVYTGKAAPPGAPVLANQPRVVEDYKDWEYVDCYSENVNNVRALPTRLGTTVKTVEACLDACAAKGFTKCGVQYHGECWGGNTLAGTSKPIGFDYCGLTCDDNPLQYCGGSQPTAFEYYTRTSTNVPVTTSQATTTTIRSSTSTSKVSTTTSKTTTTSVAPSSTALVGKLTNSPDWTYTACYNDLINGARTLPNQLDNPAKTIQGCLTACKAKNYAVCALSYGGECFAGSALSVNTVKIAASVCTMKCGGDSSKTCGGPQGLDVYMSKTIKALSAPSKPNLASFNGYKFTGCYTDLVDNKRSLDLNLRNSNQTIEACLNSCSSAGAKVCGLSFYGECYGSKTGLSNAATKVDASECAYPCKGNGREYCGGKARLSIYSGALSKRGVVSFEESTMNRKVRRQGAELF